MSEERRGNPHPSTLSFSKRGERESVPRGERGERESSEREREGDVENIKGVFSSFLSAIYVECGERDSLSLSLSLFLPLFSLSLSHTLFRNFFLPLFLCPLPLSPLGTLSLSPLFENERVDGWGLPLLSSLIFIIDK